MPKNPQPGNGASGIPIQASYSGLLRKKLGSSRDFFFFPFWSQKVVHSKNLSFRVGNYAKHSPLPPLAWRLSRERSILGLRAPVICFLGLKLTTTRCLYIFFFFLQRPLPEAQMRQAGGSSQQGQSQAQGRTQGEKQGWC